MEEINIKAKFAIDEQVTHICNSEVAGVVVDWRYYRRTQSFQYQVTFGIGVYKMWVEENELLAKKDETTN